MTAIDTATARERLKKKPRKKPYYHSLERGIALGWRYSPSGGETWLVRVERDRKRWEKGLALVTDDFGTARDAALKLAKGENHGNVTDTGKPVTVKEAIVDYREDLVTCGSRPYQADRLIGGIHAQTRKPLPSLVPTAILAKPVALLTTKELRRFRDDLAKRMKLVSVNRVLKPFRAALTRAADLSDGQITNDKTWRTGLQAFRDDHESKNDDAVWEKDEIRRFALEAEKLGEDFGLFAETKFGTGVRFVSLLRLRVRDVLPDDELNMPRSLKGKKGQKTITREPVAIIPALAERLREAAKGRDPNAPLLVRADGTPWNYSYVRKLWDRAMGKAGITKKRGVVTTAARHSSITHMLLDRTTNVNPQLVVAAHDTSLLMVQRHYAKKITKHGQSILRAARLDLTGAPSSPSPPRGANVLPMRKRA